MNPRSDRTNTAPPGAFTAERAAAGTCTSAVDPTGTRTDSRVVPSTSDHAAVASPRTVRTEVRAQFTPVRPSGRTVKVR